MELTLVYTGSLPSGTGSNRKARKEIKDLTFSMRREFHVQLVAHWKAEQELQPIAESGFSVPPHDEPSNSWGTSQIGKFRFLPLVCDGRMLKLICRLDIEIRSRSDPDAIVQSSGDLDNRLGILFDALSMPQLNQLPDDAAPGDGEGPFLCLLEDDKMITKLTVETLKLLTPAKPDRERQLGGGEGTCGGCRWCA